MSHPYYKMPWYSQYWVEEVLDYLIPLASAALSAGLVAWFFNR